LANISQGLTAVRDFGSMNDRSGLQKRTLLQSMCLRRFVPKRTYARQQSEPPLDDLVGMAEQRQPLPPRGQQRPPGHVFYSGL